MQKHGAGTRQLLRNHGVKERAGNATLHDDAAERRMGWSCPGFVDSSPLGMEDATIPRTHLPYTPEYRRRMVELVRSGRSPDSVAEEYEPSGQSILNWDRQAERDAGRRLDGLSSEEKDELRRLRRENRKLREDREILAKAAAWFAQETDKTPRGSSSS